MDRNTGFHRDRIFKNTSKNCKQAGKKNTLENVFDIRDLEVRENILTELPIEEIWGISTRWGRRLRKIGIETAQDLAEANPRHVRKTISIVG